MVAGLQVSAVALLSIAAGVTLLAIAWRGWPFQRYPGALTWTTILVTVAIWDISYGLGLMVFDPALRRWFDIPVLLGRALSIPLILAFALEYTGRERLARSNWMLALIAFYAVAFVAAATNPYHHLMWTDYHISPVLGAAAVDFTPRLYYVLAAVSYLTVLGAVVLLAETIARYRDVYGRQVIALIIALAVPSIANVVWMFRLGPTAHLDLTPIGHIVIASLLTYALFREDMFTVAPATRFKAERAALEDLATGVISVTNDGVVININQRAGELLGLEPSDALLRPITDLVAIELPLTETTVTLSNPFDRQREYNAVISEIESETHQVIGYTVTLQDVTTERLRQQRLAVLNRILRHNLRNDLNVVDGYAEIIEKEPEHATEHAGHIRETVADLIGIGEKAQTVEHLLSSERPTETIPVSAVVRRTVDELGRSAPDWVIEVRGDDVEVPVNAPVVSAVLRELIENACVHNDTERARVEVAVEYHPTAVNPIAITVRDNGPGIPPHELRPLREGMETTLEHGSGLGLWLVHWAVSTLNGEVDFTESDSGGTTVILRLPVADETDQ